MTHHLQMPPDPVPMTTLAEAATAAHELYLGYTLAGFTEDQALYLVGQVVARTAAASGGPVQE